MKWEDEVKAAKNSSDPRDRKAYEDAVQGARNFVLFFFILGAIIEIIYEIYIYYHTKSGG